MNAQRLQLVAISRFKDPAKCGYHYSGEFLPTHLCKAEDQPSEGY
ncbi:MAG: hypothetical protein ACJAWP_000394 [Porticoccus sp.]|jgi:hypothetical protein